MPKEAPGYTPIAEKDPEESRKFIWGVCMAGSRAAAAASEEVFQRNLEDIARIGELPIAMEERYAIEISRLEHSGVLRKGTAVMIFIEVGVLRAKGELTPPSQPWLRKNWKQES